MLLLSLTHTVSSVHQGCLPFKALTTQWGEKGYRSHETTRSKALGPHNTNITTQVLFTGEVQHFTLCQENLSGNDNLSDQKRLGGLVRRELPTTPAEIRGPFVKDVGRGLLLCAGVGEGRGR